MGECLEIYAKKHGFTLFYNKLLKEAVPKMIGLFSTGLTLIRTAIWRATGNVMGNLTTSFLSMALGKVTDGLFNIINQNNMAQAWQLATRCLSLGSMIALILDWGTDGDPFNNKIEIKI